MVRNPPATGNAELDRFLSSVKDELDTAAKPTQGWKLSDFHAEVSEVISDERDLIDIIRNWDDINQIKANFETEIAKYEKLYTDSKVLGDQYRDHAEVFAQVMEWWAQNVRLIEEAEAIFDQVKAGETSASASAAAASASATAAWEAVDTPGRQGPPGPAVTIVSQVTLPDNSVQVTFSDDSVLTVPAGLQGAPGKRGTPGADGDLSPEDRALVVAATGHAADAAQSAADAEGSAGMAEDSAQAAAQSAVDAAEAVTSGLADGSVTRVKLAVDVTDELDGKAPVEHEHPMAQIPDLPEVSQQAAGDALVRRWIDGSISVPLSPDDPADATSKSYVDSAVAGAVGAVSSVNERTGDVVLGAADVGAAPAGHGHVVAEVSGLSTALESIEDRPTVSTVSGMIEGAVDALVGSAPEALDTLYEIAAKLADQGDAVAALVSAIAEKAPVSHPHTMEQVTGLVAALEGKAATGHSHTPSSLGAAPSHVEVTGEWPSSPAPGTLYWKGE